MLPGVRKKRQIPPQFRPWRDTYPFLVLAGMFSNPPNHAFPFPAALHGNSLAPFDQSLPRQCLRRNLPFLPDPCEASTKYSLTKIIDEFVKSRKVSFFVIPAKAEIFMAHFILRFYLRFLNFRNGISQHSSNCNCLALRKVFQNCQENPRNPP